MLTTDLPATAISITQHDFFARSLPPPSLNSPAPPPKTPVVPPQSIAPRPEKDVKSTKSESTATKPKPFWPSVSSSTNLITADELLVRRVIEEQESDIDDVKEDDGTSVEDLLATTNDEPTSTFVAKRLMQLLKDDLSGKSYGEPDLFGHIDHARETRKLDALFWLYDLNPDGAKVSFTWVCDELGHDPEVIRRVVAKNMRAELKRVLNILCGMVSLTYATDCQLVLSEYVDLTGWNLS